MFIHFHISPLHFQKHVVGQALSNVLMDVAYHGMSDVMESKIVQDAMMRMRETVLDLFLQHVMVGRQLPKLSCIVSLN